MKLDINIEQLANQLNKRRLTICTAESCTGGLIAKLFTDKAGSSNWFDCSFVTYSNNAKQLLLGVNPSTLKDAGAVSQRVACEMAEGAIKNSSCKVAISVTGIAGPDGGSKEKPVGMVWIAWAGRNYETLSQCFYFDGDRNSIREQAANAAIAGAVKYIVNNA